GSRVRAGRVARRSDLRLPAGTAARAIPRFHHRGRDPRWEDLRSALVPRRRAPLLPDRSRSARAEDLRGAAIVRARRHGEKPGPRRVSLAGPPVRGAQLQRVRGDLGSRRRSAPRRPHRPRHGRRPCGARFLARSDRQRPFAALRRRLRGGGDAPGFPGRPRRLPAQLALCLGRGAEARLARARQGRIRAAPERDGRGPAAAGDAVLRARERFHPGRAFRRGGWPPFAGRCAFPRPAHRRSSRVPMKARSQAALLAAPAMAILAGVAVLPVLAAIWLSLHRSILVFHEERFIGIANFRFLFSDGRFWSALGTTAYFTTVAVAAELLIGLPVAMLLHRGGGLFRAAILLPWAI